MRPYVPLMSGLLCLLAALPALATSSAEQEENLSCLAFKVFDRFSLVRRVDGDISRAYIVRKLGRPLALKRWQEPDSREPGVINTEHRWTYQGLRLWTSSPQGMLGSPATWLVRVEIDDGRYRLCRGLRVGQPLASFVRLLGEAEASSPPNDDKVVYDAQAFASVRGISFAGQATIVLQVDPQGMVKAITWEYWAD